MTCIAETCPRCAEAAERTETERELRRAALRRAAARKAEADRQRSAVRWLAVGA